MKGQDTGYGEMPTNKGEEIREPDPLQDALVRVTIADATFRKERDAFIATCRDHLHYALQLVGPIDPKRIHSVINIMDDFLNHRSRK